MFLVFFAYSNRHFAGTYSLLSADSPRKAPGSIKLIRLLRRSLWGKKECLVKQLALVLIVTIVEFW